MFIILPLSVLLASVVGVFLIVSRKFVYLKKLTPEIIQESGVADEGFWQVFFGEIIVQIKSIQIREQSVRILTEIEKSLRKIRLFALKIEGSIYNLIVKIRTQVKQHEERLNQAQEGKDQVNGQAVAEISSRENAVVNKSSSDPVAGYQTKSEHVILEDDQKYWREEEQRLIMAIAKSPRDAALYKQLGNVYVQTNEYDDARQSFETALKLDPADYVTKTRLSRVLHILKNGIIGT